MVAASVVASAVVVREVGMRVWECARAVWLGCARRVLQSQLVSVR